MITIYTKDNCIYCNRAKTLMKSRDIPFQEQVLGRDFDLDYFQEVFPRVKTFPFILNGIEDVGGYMDLVEAVAANPAFGKTILNEDQF